MKCNNTSEIRLFCHNYRQITLHSVKLSNPISNENYPKQYNKKFNTPRCRHCYQISSLNYHNAYIYAAKSYY